jgi:hypothetical protein
MMAPVSGNPCFLYRTTVWQQRKSESQKWEKLAEETLHQPFFIDDSTGHLPIDPSGADLDLLREFREEYDAWTFSPTAFSQEEDNHHNQDKKTKAKIEDDQLPASALVFLSRHGIVPDHRLRIEECLIKPNDILFVAGTLVETPDAERHPLSQQNDHRHTSSPLDPAPNSLSEPLSVPQVIRLAASAAASSSSHMTQQGKITAALTRAGIAEPAPWSAAEIPHQNVDAPNNASPATPLAHFEALRQQYEAPQNQAPQNQAPQNQAPQNQAPQNEAEPDGEDWNNIPMTELQTNEVQWNSAETNTIQLDDLRAREPHSNEEPSAEELSSQELSNQELSNEEQSNGGPDLPVPVSLMKGADDPTFVISFRSQKEFCSALARKSAALLWGGAALTLVGVCTLLAQLAIH